MNRLERRAAARIQRRKVAPACRPKANPDAIPLRATPWKVSEVFSPLERILDRIAIDGTVDVGHQGRAVFSEAGGRTQFETVPAIQGIVDFHKLAAKRLGVEIDTSGLEKLAAKLDYDTPLTEADLARAVATIADLKQFALRHLTAGEAKSLLHWEQERIKEESTC